MINSTSPTAILLPLFLCASVTLCFSSRADELPLVVVDRDNVEIRESCRVQIDRDWIADADGNGVVHVLADGVTVDFAGQHLRGAPPGRAPDDYEGIGVRITARNVTLRNAKVSGFKGGIWASRADGLVIEDCDVSHNFRQRLKSTPRAEDLGDWLWPHFNDDNEWLTRYGAGIYIEESADVTVRRCTARHSQNGLCLRKVERSQVYDNDFSFLSGWGIALFRSSHNVIARNNCDFCVRGYSHGVYARGQDSAGILAFEQCSDNLFALNSATHSGDGFFGYAGNEALEGDVDHTRRGNNRNLLYRNDFSYAPAIGIENTFSFDNRYIENRLVGSNYGIWGGYSSDTHVEGNEIADNTIAGVAVEHGSNWMVVRNELRDNARGVQFWWDDDEDLLAKPWAKVNNTASRGHQIAGNRIRVGAGQVGIELTGGTTDIRVYANDWSGDGQRFRVDEDSRYEELEAPVPLRPFHDERLVNLPGKREAVGLRRHLAGRERIIITEWGPYDWQSPYLHYIGPDAEGDLYRVLGEAPPGGAGILPAPSAKATGDVTVELDAEASPPTVRVRPRQPGVVTPYELSVVAGDETLTRRGVAADVQWTIGVFAWQTDPREDYDAWKREAAGAVEFTAPRLDLRYGMGGPSQLPGAPEHLRDANLPRDRFGTLAHTRLAVPAGRWRISTTSDDGVRVWADGRLLIDNWTHHAPTVDTADLDLEHDTTLTLRVEHFELDGYAVLSLELTPRE